MVERFEKANVSAYLNFLRSKYEAFTGAIQVKSLPCYAMIDPCDICQLRCPTCPTGIESEGLRRGNREDTQIRSKRSRLEPELFDALLEEMGEYLFLIAFHSWGEPLLNEWASSFVRKAKANHIETHMHTNLSLPLSDERLEGLLEAGLDFLFASVDGFTQENYEKFRIGGNLELVKSNLENAARIRDRLGLKTRIIYKFLVFRWNEHEVDAARSYAQDLGIIFQTDDASVPDASWLPSYRNSEKPFLSEDDVNNLNQQWAAAGKPDYWRDYEKHAYWVPVHPGNDWIPVRGPEVGSYCGWHYGVAVIEPGGHVSPCCMTPKEADRLGTVVPGKTRFADVWNGDLYKKSRAAFAGTAVPDLEHADTVCTRCYFPDSLKHVYSHNDFKVFEQFFQTFRGSNPVLEQAFHILSNLKSGEDRIRFAEFFEANLMEFFEGRGASSAPGG